MPSKQPVPVTILGHEYKVRGESDAAIVKKAAKLVDETMTRVRERTGTADSVDVAVLAALNLAKHVVLLREERHGSAMADTARLDRLLALVEGAIEQSAAEGASV